MLLVILGAGATADWSPGRARSDFAWGSPLTDELVADTPNSRSLLNEIPDLAASGLVAHVRGELSRNAAGQTLETILDEAAKPDDELSRELIAFRLYVQAYLCRVSTDGLAEVGGATNQFLLVRALEHWRRSGDEPILYVTFNYDTVLDQALAGQYGWKPNGDLSSYIQDARFRLLKLHGSYNWGQVTTNPSPWGYGVGPGVDWKRTFREEILRLAATGGLNVTTQLRLLTERISNQGADWVHTQEKPERNLLMVPALAVPLRSKARFVCPLEHVEELNRLLPEVDRILSVGWKAGEPHFIERLGAIPPNARLLVVNRTAHSRRAVAETISARTSVRLEPDDDGDRKHAFTELVRSGALGRFLS